MEQLTMIGRLAPAKSRFLQEILIVGLGYLVYSQVRGLASDRVVDAFANGRRIVEIERNLGIFKELAIQTYVLPHDTLVHLFNVIYFYGLFPLLIPTAIFLFVKRPKVYVLTRNAFLLSGGIAVIFFLLLPTAPPRLLDLGFIDTLNRSLTPSYSSIPGVNHYAALPSMHVGWNFLTAYALFLAFDNVRVRAAFLLFPAVMLASTVVTGNHYILDGVLGIVVAAVALLMARYLQRWQELREKRKLQAPSAV
jgi:membrane-associated phospholipid phosphatase